MDLENRIVNVFKKLIFVEKDDNKFEVSLPQFINTGDAVDILIEVNEKDVILSNSLYRSLERKLSEKYSENYLREKIFLNPKKKSKLKEEYLFKNNILLGLKLEKIFSRNYFETNLEKEIFEYSFFISRYYNYLYDYLLERLPESEAPEIFRQEIKGYIENYNSKQNESKNKILKMSSKRINSMSTDNEYYHIGDTIVFSGLRTKYRILEALRDFKELIKLEEGDKQLFLLIAKTNSNGFTHKKVKELLEPYDEVDIKFILSRNKDIRTNFKKLLEGNNVLQ